MMIARARFLGRRPCAAAVHALLVALAGLVTSMAVDAQQPPCCTVTQIDARNALASAKVGATGQDFQFRSNDPALLRSLKVGQGVYANFATHQVSLNGRTVCCFIVSVAAASKPGAIPPAATISPAPAGQAQPPVATHATASQPDGVTPISYRLPTPSSLTLDPDSLVGGVTLSGTVTLSGAAPQGGVQIAMATNAPTVVAVPNEVLVPAGSTTANVSISTHGVPLEGGAPRPAKVLISASGAPTRLATLNQKVTQTATLDVLPALTESVGIGTRNSPLPLGRCSAPEVSHAGGYRLDGCVLLTGEAADETDTSTMGRGFPLHERGAVVQLASSNPQLAAVPGFAVVPVGRRQGSFSINTSPVAVASTVTIAAHRTNSDSRTVQLTLEPPALQGFQCSPQTVTGGGQFSCTLTLSGPAYGGAQAAVQFSSMQAIGDPVSSLSFQAGQASLQYAIFTLPVATDAATVVTVSFGGVSKSQSLTIQAPRPQGVSLNPPTVMSGQTSQGTVSLNGMPPGSGMNIFLQSSDPATAQVPPAVHVGPGSKTSAAFTIQAKPVSSDKAVTISAAYDSTPPTAHAQLTVKAPQAALRIYSIVWYVNGQAVQADDIQAQQSFKMCPSVVNVGGTASSPTTLEISLSQSNNTTVQTWNVSVPALSPNTGTGASGVCIDEPGLSSGYTYDFNGRFDSGGGWFFMAQLSP